ncbi:hypothetical protein CAPTEDRAFT_195037 [Capitella teleta]|uniref:Uncharacterized protein n=1 Tax=Capitella teleta TaxID=283909 RepID=R7UH88_CAPTE|nr:hypothetical protein CAPTEDRAFT_195037 [Capitella teleta]|eukprot:ELU05909.1 hypothetical protein CAPTEDRAFT_195037 [Capitella teleta]
MFQYFNKHEQKIKANECLHNYIAISKVTTTQPLGKFNHLHLDLSSNRFATDQEPVKSRRESESRPTQEMTGDLKRGGRLCNKAQQLSSFESEQEHGKMMERFAPAYLKDYDTDGSGSLPNELEVDMQVPSISTFSQEREEEYLFCLSGFLERDASFHRPALVLSEDEDGR